MFTEGWSQAKEVWPGRWAFTNKRSQGRVNEFIFQPFGCACSHPIRHSAGGKSHGHSEFGCLITGRAPRPIPSNLQGRHIPRGDSQTPNRGRGRECTATVTRDLGSPDQGPGEFTLHRYDASIITVATQLEQNRNHQDMHKITDRK